MQDSATPIDLNHTTSSARNEPEMSPTPRLPTMTTERPLTISPLTQLRVQEASSYDYQILEDSPQHGGRPDGPNAHPDYAAHVNEKKGSEEKRGNQVARVGLEESQRARGKIGANATPSKQQMGPIDSDIDLAFASFSRDLASDLHHYVPGNAESMPDNAMTPHDAHLQASKWKHNSTLGASSAFQHAAYQTARAPQGQTQRNSAHEGKSP